MFLFGYWGQKLLFLNSNFSSTLFGKMLQHHRLVWQESDKASFTTLAICHIPVGQFCLSFRYLSCKELFGYQLSCPCRKMREGFKSGMVFPFFCAVFKKKKKHSRPFLCSCWETCFLPGKNATSPVFNNSRALHAPLFLLWGYGISLSSHTCCAAVAEDGRKLTHFLRVLPQLHGHSQKELNSTHSPFLNLTKSSSSPHCWGQLSTFPPPHPPTVSQNLSPFPTAKTSQQGWGNLGCSSQIS